MKNPYLMPAAAVRQAEDLATLAHRINAEHQHVEDAVREGLAHARAAGDLLLKAKEGCGYGRWLPWLEANVRFGERTAQAYMQVARRWEELTGKAQRVADLSLRDAIRLIAVSPPEAASGTAEPFTWPALEPGFRYMACGRSRFGTTVVEVDPHPDHPGFWVIACFHMFDGGENTGGFVEFLGKGVRLDDPDASDGLRKLMLDSCDFQPDKTGWMAGPRMQGKPYAVAMYKDQWRARLRQDEDDLDDDDADLDDDDEDEDA